MTTLPTTSEWLRAGSTAPLIGVDREAGEAGIIHGVVLAQEGPFKTDGRGAFDGKSLKLILGLLKAEPVGLKSRFTHPDESGDSLGKTIGRMKNPRMDSVAVRGSNGQQLTDQVQAIRAVRADLHILKTAMLEPPGGGGTPYGEYVMSLAEEDSALFATSLAIGPDVELEHRTDRRGRPLLDKAGKELPPLWRPKTIHASDVVDTGEAVDGFLTAAAVDHSLPNVTLWRAAHLLDAQFADQPREVIQARCLAYLDRYLSRRFGVEPEEVPELSGDLARSAAVGLEDESGASATGDDTVPAAAVDDSPAYDPSLDRRRRLAQSQLLDDERSQEP